MRRLRVATSALLLLVAGLLACSTKAAKRDVNSPWDGSDAGAGRFVTDVSNDLGVPLDATWPLEIPEPVPTDVGVVDQMDLADSPVPEDADQEIADLDVALDLSPGPWRSVLYPDDWQAGFADEQGRFLHDFSYAGYHNSGIGLPAIEELQVTVTVTGADPTGESDSTAAIQSALDAAAGAGGVVLLPAGLYRVDGVLSVTASNVVLLGEGAEASRIFFSRTEAMTGKAHLTFSGSISTSHEVPLSADADALSFDVVVADGSLFEVGDDVSLGWVITDEFIAEHGMTGTWVAFNGTWQTFFRRTVVAVDLTVTPHVITLDVPLRYPAKLRDMPTLRRETGYLSEVGVVNLGLATAVDWEGAWANERSHALSFQFVKDGWVQGVASFASPLAPEDGPGAGTHLQNGGIQIHGSKRVTVADSTMAKAQNRGGGGCGYLFEIRMSSDILTRDCVGKEGRHNFIQNWGFGTTGCVWLRCHSAGGLTVALKDFPEFGGLGFSEFHHSLATANLMDSNVVDDGWKAANRNDWSTGAGHTATQSVFWNMQGSGELVSRQFGWGYIVGTGAGMLVRTSLGGGFDEGKGTEPEDWLEGEGVGQWLEPSSLFEDQLARRLP
jgi:hypothetical protein